jgi:hypothetical protein
VDISHADATRSGLSGFQVPLTTNTSGVLVQGVFFEECAGADVPLLEAVGAIKRSRTWQRAIGYGNFRRESPCEAGQGLVNRHRADVTERYPELGMLAQLSAGTILDGEVVVLRQGKPDFGLLLSRNQARAPLKIQSLARSLPITYVVFDLLYDRFESLLALPLSTRRERLEKLVRACANSRLVFSEGIVGRGRAFFEAVCREDLEGVVAKRLDGRYRPGRRAWIKIKPKSGNLLTGTGSCTSAAAPSSSMRFIQVATVLGQTKNLFAVCSSDQPRTALSSRMARRSVGR